MMTSASMLWSTLMAITPPQHGWTHPFCKTDSLDGSTPRSLGVYYEGHHPSLDDASESSTAGAPSQLGRGSSESLQYLELGLVQP